MSTSRQHAVVVAGGGPTGLTLAIELAIAGVDVAVVERRADQTVAGSRAGGLHSRTIELFDQRGIADRFLALGKTMQIASFAMNPLDISDFPTRHPSGLALWQEPIERVLAERAAELSITTYRSTDVTGFTQDDDGVDVVLADGTTLRAAYLVGCDGGRSVVRKQAGIDFAGVDASVSWVIAEAQMAETPAVGLRMAHNGTYGMSFLEDASGQRTARLRMVLVEPVVRSGEATIDDLKRGLIELYGTDFGVHSPTWISRFSDTTRQASTYRNGRVLIAGDAAHIHSPVGGQGLNLGVHDAMNLGWKLALVVGGLAPAALLDSYERERHPVAARALKTTMAQTALTRGDDRTKAARETIGDLLKVPAARQQTAAMLSGLDIRFDVDIDAHPLLGRRVPDLDVVIDGVVRRLFTLLHDGKGLLLDLSSSSLQAWGWRDRVQHVVASSDSTLALPVVGAVPTPRALLVRPDGHVAWVGDGDDAGLAAAMTTWFGPEAA